MSKVVRVRLGLDVRSGVWSCSDLVDGAGDDESLTKAVFLVPCFS
jgi:hypothetical protein